MSIKENPASLYIYRENERSERIKKGAELRPDLAGSSRSLFQNNPGRKVSGYYLARVHFV